MTTDNKELLWDAAKYVLACLGAIVAATWIVASIYNGMNQEIRDVNVAITTINGQLLQITNPDNGILAQAAKQQRDFNNDIQTKITESYEHRSNAVDQKLNTLFDTLAKRMDTSDLALKQVTDSADFIAQQNADFKAQLDQIKSQLSLLRTVYLDMRSFRCKVDPKNCPSLEDK